MALRILLYAPSPFLPGLLDCRLHANHPPLPSYPSQAYRLFFTTRLTNLIPSEAPWLNCSRLGSIACEVFLGGSSATVSLSCRSNLRSITRSFFLYGESSPPACVTRGYAPPSWTPGRSSPAKRAFAHACTSQNYSSAFGLSK